MSVVDEIVRGDHVDLLECIYAIAKTTRRNVKESGSYSLVHLAAGNDGTKCL